MSRLPFEMLLGLRYLRPKRTFVSVITLISVLGLPFLVLHPGAQS
jgi:lipoprotein-releasing system permease protein